MTKPVDWDAIGKSLDLPDWPTDTAEPVHLTELGNARRLVRRDGQDLRYIDPWGKWLTWDGTRWAIDDTGEVHRRAKATPREVLAEATSESDDDERKRLTKHAMDSEKAVRIRAAVELARSEPGIAILPDTLDRDPMLFNVANGTLDLRTGRLKDHTRADHITKAAAVRHDADATCPRFHTFLEQILPDPAVRDYLQRLVGYSMTGSTAEQILLILYGSGENGKSTLIDLIRDLFGDYGQQAPMDTFLERSQGIPNDIARLRGARLVAASEVNEGKRLNESLVKSMTGGDVMVGRFLRAEFFEFKPQFQAWLATNHKPDIRGTDHAIWRRIRLIEFGVTVTPEQRDNDLPAKLRAELPGILNWALAGCQAWQADGLATPAAVTQATADYREDADIIGAFLEDCCELGDGRQAVTSALYTRYGYWCQANGHDQLAQPMLGRRLKERGLIAAKSGNTRFWRGISLRSSEDG